MNRPDRDNAPAIAITDASVHDVLREGVGKQPIDWPIPLQSRRGGRTLLGGIEIFYDFDWRQTLTHRRAVFPNCKSISRKIKSLTPEARRPVLLLTSRDDVPSYSVEAGVDGSVVHILNIDAIKSVSADPADSLLGRESLPDLHIDAALDHVDEVPGALEAILSDRISAHRLLTWATTDDQRQEEIPEAVSLLEPSQAARLTTMALEIVGSAGPALGSLEDAASQSDPGIVQTAALNATFVHQKQAVAELEALLRGEHPERTYQRFFEDEHWMFGSQFVGRWHARQVTIGDQQDLILLTADGFSDVIELKRPTDDVLRWDDSRNCYFPSPTLAKALGQVQQYLMNIDSELHVIRSRHKLDVYRARAVIVIGSIPDDDHVQRAALRGLNSHLSRIEVWTYSQILGMAKAILGHSRERLEG